MARNQLDDSPSPGSIAPDLEDSFTIVGGTTAAGVIVLCDHAANAFPPGYGTLGLPPGELRRHIAYDIGAAAVTRGLAEGLGAPALLTHYSRLLIDPNRGEDDPTIIMRISDGAVVPGNRTLDAAEREKRIAHYYRPYHNAIDHVIDQFIANGRPPILLSIHTFTESWKGAVRPWHVGVLWDRDPRLARPLLDAFYAENDLIVGDNEPYRGDLRGDTMWQHGTMRGLAHAIVEIRQDLVRDENGQKVWSERLLATMQTILENPQHRSQLSEVLPAPTE